MGNVNTGSIADNIYNAIPDLPSTLSGTHITNNVNKARLKVQQYTGDTISSTAITEDFQPVIETLAMGYTYASMSGKGVGFDFGVTEFRLSKSGNAHESLARFHFAEAASELRYLGFGNIGFKKVNG